MKILLFLTLLRAFSATAKCSEQTCEDAGLTAGVDANGNVVKEGVCAHGMCILPLEYSAAKQSCEGNHNMSDFNAPFKGRLCYADEYGLSDITGNPIATMIGCQDHVATESFWTDSDCQLFSFKGKKIVDITEEGEITERCLIVDGVFDQEERNKYRCCLDSEVNSQCGSPTEPVSDSKLHTTFPTDYPTPEPTYEPTFEPSYPNTSEPVVPTEKPTDTNDASEPFIIPEFYIDDYAYTCDQFWGQYGPCSSHSHRGRICACDLHTFAKRCPATCSSYEKASKLHSKFPTEYPTPEPTYEPTFEPTEEPTDSKHPTTFPSRHPTHEPTYFPTKEWPTFPPTAEPTVSDGPCEMIMKGKLCRRQEKCRWNKNKCILSKKYINQTKRKCRKHRKSAEDCLFTKGCIAFFRKNGTIRKCTVDMEALING